MQKKMIINQMKYTTGETAKASERRRRRRSSGKRKDIESFAQKQMLVEKGERQAASIMGSSQQDAADKRCKDESAVTKKLM